MHMNENSNIPEELIVKFLSGETNREETEYIMNKINTDKEWNDIYLKSRKIFDATNSAYIDNMIDVDKAINDFLNKTNETPLLKIENKASKKILWTIISIAASITIILIVWRWFDKSNNIEIISENSTKDGIVLPDNSVVRLYPHSKISFQNKFTDKIRNVKLQGTAFFEVQRNSHKPFVISTKELNIKVVGTSFWVYSSLNENYTSVKVKTGKVLLLQKNIDPKIVKDSMLLFAGDSGVWSKNVHRFYSNNPDSNSKESKNIRFEKTKLIDVVIVISKTYNVRIEIANHAIDDCKITAHFENQSLQAILEMLRTILNVSIIQENGIIIIDGKGC